MICGAALMAALTIKYPTEMVLHGQTYVPAIGLVTAVAGALLPDADMKTTTAGRKLGLIGTITSKLFTHRGLTHTLFFPTLLYVWMTTITIPVVPSLLFGLIVGWLSHIIADIFNGKGVPLLWPIIRRRIHLMDIPLGAFPEGVFSVVWVAACIFIGVWS